MMSVSLICLGLCISAAIAQNPYQTGIDANGHYIPTYSPARPPAIPLAVRSPYTSFWLTTSYNGTINSVDPMFWPGNTVGWEGIVVVDGVPYEYFGVGSSVLPAASGLQTAVPQTVSYDTSYSNFTLTAGPVMITASFFSPVIPKDICRTSIPLSYLTTSVKSMDGFNHSIQFYADINGAWNSYEANATITWNLYADSTPWPDGASANGSSSVFSWLYNLATPYFSGEEYQFPEWGNFTWSSAQGSASSFTFNNGYAQNVRFDFAKQHTLNNTVETDYRGPGIREPVFAFSHDFGSAFSASAMYTIGSAQVPAMRYMSPGGVVSLDPWWMKCYGDIFQMIDFHYNDIATCQSLAYDFDSQLKGDIDSYYSASRANVWSNLTVSGPQPYYGNSSSDTYYYGTNQYGERYMFNAENGMGFLNPSNYTGIAPPDVRESESYYAITALAARQIMGAYVLAVPPGGPAPFNETDYPLSFQKEISSDGNVNTVDVVYPAMSFFLYANPNLLKYNLEPLFQNQEGGFYPNGYSMHDLGTNFPNATGHPLGTDEYMPVEECGNMLIMAYSYYKYTGDAGYLYEHYDKLYSWALYLVEFAKIPFLQLSTDDFAGLQANNTNLALKGILGIEIMAQISSVVGNTAHQVNLSTTATDYMDFWLKNAINPQKTHVMKSYEWRSSWGLLYNAYPDKLLNLGMVPDWVYRMESKWYATVSQVFGIPLDEGNTYTKTDWSLLVASFCEPSTRHLIVNSIAYWVNNTDTQFAFTDLYETDSYGGYPYAPSIVFIARPVLGALYSLVAMGKSGMNSLTGAKINSTFVANSTDHLSEIVYPKQASTDLYGDHGSASIMSPTLPSNSTLTTMTMNTTTMTMSTTTTSMTLSKSSQYEQTMSQSTAS